MTSSHAYLSVCASREDLDGTLLPAGPSAIGLSHQHRLVHTSEGPAADLRLDLDMKVPKARGQLQVRSCLWIDRSRIQIPARRVSKIGFCIAVLPSCTNHWARTTGSGLMRRDRLALACRGASRRSIPAEHLQGKGSKKRSDESEIRVGIRVPPRRTCRRSGASCLPRTRSRTPMYQVSAATEPEHDEIFMCVHV